MGIFELDKALTAFSTGRQFDNLSSWVEQVHGYTVKYYNSANKKEAKKNLEILQKKLKEYSSWLNDDIEIIDWESKFRKINRRNI